MRLDDELDDPPTDGDVAAGCGLALLYAGFLWFVFWLIWHVSMGLR